MSYEFYSTFPKTRPIRTSEKTRKFAKESLEAKYGREALKTMAIEADGIEGFDELSAYDKYDISIRLVAENAPIRICDDELLCGSSTLGEAIDHSVPVTFGGKSIKHRYGLDSVSHVTSGFDRALREGLDSYRVRIHKRMERGTTPEELVFLKSLENALDCLTIWHSRYMDALRERMENAVTDEEKKHYSELIENLKNVPFAPPTSFREGLQSLWFMFAYTRLMGNWSGIGRIDVMLGDLLEKDLASGKITIDEARELVAHFWIKGCEWICLNGEQLGGSGDAQHYQNIVLSGCGADGKDVTCTLTYLVLDVVEEFPISDFPIAVRVNENTDQKLLEKIAMVQRHGGGVVAIYNETLIIKSLVDFGYSIEEARLFANDGCWEVQVPGKTYFTYHPSDMYTLYQREVLGNESEEIPDYKSYDELFEKFHETIAAFMVREHDSYHSYAKNGRPASVIALFEDDCIENAKDYFSGGCKYNVRAPHFGGVPDTANSLYAIKKIVFDEGRMSFREFMDVLRNNWEGHEELRQYALNKLTYYGNDNEEVDNIYADVVKCFIDESRKVEVRNNVLRPPGISTFGRQIEYSKNYTAHAFGKPIGAVLASNLSPTPGTDLAGATAVIKSHCKAPLNRLTCGTALDLKLDPGSVRGDEGIAAMVGLMRAFISLGGFFMQTDVLDNEVLLRAKEHPEDYQNLSVRISGWSARFVTLNNEWQNMIIERTTQM